jgi:hypothetical protein
VYVTLNHVDILLMREDITSLFSFLTFAQLYWAQVSFREPEPWLTYAGNMVTMVKIPEST